jgi:PAS domain-containing protein
LAAHKSRNDSAQLNQQYLEAILNNTNLPIYLKNADYKYIFMNRQLGRLAHVAHDQVLGKDDFAIFSLSLKMTRKKVSLCRDCAIKLHPDFVDKDGNFPNEIEGAFQHYQKS